MARTIEIQCCEGNEQYEGQCLKSKCPWYVKGKKKVDRRWPRMSTGFGNAYGEPKHNNYLGQIREDVQSETKKVE